MRAAVHDLRQWAHDKHRSVDDIPYGGGPGMVMKPEPLVEAIEALAGPKGQGRTARVILLSPQGFPFRQERAEVLAGESHLVLVCGRYEGVDQRVVELAVDLELSVGRLRALRRRGAGHGGDRGGRAPRARGARKPRLGGDGIVRNR